MLTDPATCAHGATRSEGCPPCEGLEFARDEDGFTDVELAERFEAYATVLAEANTALAAWLIELDEQAGFVADYPRPDGLF